MGSLDRKILGYHQNSRETLTDHLRGQIPYQQRQAAGLAVPAHKNDVGLPQASLFNDGFLGAACAHYYDLGFHSAVLRHFVDPVKMRRKLMPALHDSRIRSSDRLGIDAHRMQDNHPGTAGLAEKKHLLNSPIAEMGSIRGQQQGFSLAKETG